LRPQQLNINVATWVRLLKRVPEQTAPSDSSSEATVEYSKPAPAVTPTPAPTPAPAASSTPTTHDIAPSPVGGANIASSTVPIPADRHTDRLVDREIPVLPPKQSKQEVMSHIALQPTPKLDEIEVRVKHNVVFTSVLVYVLLVVLLIVVVLVVVLLLIVQLLLVLLVVLLLLPVLLLL